MRGLLRTDRAPVKQNPKYFYIIIKKVNPWHAKSVVLNSINIVMTHHYQW